MNNGQEHVLYQNILTSELKMLSSKTKKKTWNLVKIHRINKLLIVQKKDPYTIFHVDGIRYLTGKYEKYSGIENQL